MTQSSHSPGEDLHLALFFTRGVSLASWERAGLLPREIALYRAMHDLGARFTFVTHGRAEDLAFDARLPEGTRVLCNRWGLPGRVYRPLMRLLHGRALASVDVIKSNQTEGADLALRTARRLGKPFVARCGYLLFDFMAKAHGADSPQAKAAHALEQEVFTGADAIIVTTEAMLVSVARRFPETAGRLEIIPNFVDLDLFRPAPPGERPREHRLVSIGRLNAQKNFAALIEAVRHLNVSLDIIGEGEERPRLERLAADMPHVRLLGAVPHSDLPAQIREAAIYVQPTLYEGHPKTILEAMACGVPVITTDVPGVGDLLTHGENAWLCEPTAASLRAAIERVLGDDALSARLGEAARRFVAENCALDKIAARELALHRRLAAARNP